MRKFLIILLFPVFCHAQKMEVSQFASGFFRGWHESIQAWHWGTGKFWDNRISWHNKYKADLKHERFPGSTSVFVFATDGYHLTNFLTNVSNVATIYFALGEKLPFKKVVKKILICGASNLAGFYLSYNLIFK